MWRGTMANGDHEPPPPEAWPSSANRVLRARRLRRAPDELNPRELGVQLARLGRLHAELALAEVKRPLMAAAVAVVTAVVAMIASVTALVVLLAAALAPLFGGRWQHLLITGVGTMVIAAAAVAWSVWRLRRL